MDARHVGDGETLCFDLAIIGGGMAGITLAESLRGSDKRICLIEGGGLDPESASQAMYRGRNIGHPYYELDRCRFRLFGGSSIRWGGWCRPLDPWDFEARDWLTLSGWPISADELAPFYASAASLIGLERATFDLGSWDGHLPAAPSFGGAELEPALIQHRPKPDFGVRAHAGLARAANVTVLLHGNVTEIVADSDRSRAGHLRVATSPRRRPFTVRAPIFVLATGGIENARLLLASRDSDSRGLGNATDFVGRCFMEHLHLLAGQIQLRDSPDIPAFFRWTQFERASVQGILTPTADALHRRRLPSCSLAIEPLDRPVRTAALQSWPAAIAAPLSALDRRARRRVPALERRLRATAFASSTAVARARTGRRARRTDRRPTGTLSLYARGEQAPNLASRVTLGDRRDRFGRPLAQLDWRFGRSDLEAVYTWADILDASLRRSGAGRCFPSTDLEAPRVTGGPHHMGTTRMSHTPRDGVVDRNCRVHTVDNLYVAGSSVFTTGGHANPSLTILALTLRLADHLRSRI